MLKFYKIYYLNESQLETLKKYINDNLKKVYIKRLILLIGVPILFVLKKDGKLRLYVDYRQFNNIIRKNRYPLPLIEELKDRIKTA